MRIHRSICLVPILPHQDLNMSSMYRAAFFGSALIVACVIVLRQYLSPSIPDKADRKRRDLDSETIFKISLRPINLKDDQSPEHEEGQKTEDLVRKAFNVENQVQIQVLSIVNDSFLNAQVGTMCFSKIPGSIDQKRTNQKTLSKSEDLPGISMNVKLDFTGLTPLYSGSIDRESLE